MSALDILRLHTAFPYYAFFLSRTHPAALDSHTKRTRTRSHALGRGVPMPRRLRYCRSCVRRDMASLGETYWRRMHQLTGVLFCAEHAEILVSSHVSSSSSMLEDFHDATTAASIEPQECVTLTDRERDLALDIARRCQGLVTSAPSKWVHFFLHPVELYRRAAVELGYDFGMQKLNSKRIAHDFYDFYGSAFLSKFGIAVSSHYSQAQDLMNGGVDHPLIHVLMQRFLEQRFEDMGIDFQFTRKQVGHIRCPNPYAAHAADFRIENVVRKKPSSGSAYLVANCTCGFGFTFRRGDDRDPTIPIVLNRIRFGKTFEREARRLYREKPSVAYVAKMMGVSTDLAGRLVRGQKSKRESKRDPDPIRIAELRAEWKESNSKAAYQALWHHDRAWILAQKKERRPAPGKRPRRNSQEDAAIAQEIRAAAMVLLSAMTPRRVTRRAVCRQLGKPHLCNRLPRLPLSQAEMSKVTESLPEWHARKNATED